MGHNVDEAHETRLTADLPENSSVKLIGLGGVGGIVARYGGIFLASVGRAVRLVLIDGDAFEPGNASRMWFARHGNKAAVVRDELVGGLQGSDLTVIAVEEYVDSGNLSRLVRSGDVVLLAVDNHATRKLVSDHVSTLDEIVLISGGNDGAGPDSSGRVLRGTYGNCQIYVRRGGADVSPSLSRYHAEIREPGDHSPTELDCTELAASVPQIIFANLMAAASMLNALWLHCCGALHYGELAFDIFDGRMAPVLLPGPKPGA